MEGFFYKLQQMKVLFLDTPLVFSVVPRVYPLISDTLSLHLRNEMSNEVINADIEFTINDYLNVTIVNKPTDFAIQNKYEVIIYNETTIIYIGKLIVLKEGTDVQNYEYKTQNNEYFKFKE